MIRSAFIYGYTVEEDFKSFFFDEGLGIQSFIVPPKSYSLETLRAAIQTLLNETGTLIYSVTVARSTRRFTISASANFDLLPSESSSNVFSILGYTSDKLGADSYESDLQTGNVYLPQFPLESYSPFIVNQNSINGKLTIAPSGAVKATDFGLFQTMACDFKFIGDLAARQGSPIEGNLTGLQDALDFFDFCITKGNIDFSYDREDLSTFDTCFLMAAGRSRDGLSYQLIPIKKFDNFYEIRKLIFRKL